MTGAPILEAAASPAHWRTSVARSVDHVTDFETATSWVQDLADEETCVYPEPTYPTTIEAICSKPSGGWAPADEAERKRARRSTKPPTVAPTGDRSRPNPVAAGLQPRQADPVTNPAGGLPRSISPQASAAEAQRLPRAMEPHSLQRRAGRLPDRSAGPGRRRIREVVTRTPRHKTALPGRNGESAVRWAAAKVAERIGAPRGALTEIGWSPTRVGPAAPAAMLHDDPAGMPSAGARGAAEAPASTAPRHIDDRATDGARPPSNRSSVVGTHELNPRSTSQLSPTSGARLLGPPPTVSTSAPRQGDTPDESAVRHVSAHREFPAVPTRTRSSAPSSAAAGVERPDPVPAGPELVDLEKRIKQMLDEAARRHGIEV